MRLALQIALFVPLLLGFWYVHSELSVWIRWLPGLFTTRALDLAALLAGTIICGVLAGLIFALPIALLYREKAVLVAVSISAISAGFDFYFTDYVSQLPFTLAALILDLVALALALPLSVAMVSRLRPNNSFKPTPLRGVGKAS